MGTRVLSIGGTTTFLATLLFGSEAPSRVAAQTTSTRQIMREKLEHPEHLLQALVFSEFEEIRKYGTELDRLAELQSWYVLPTRSMRSTAESSGPRPRRPLSPGRTGISRLRPTHTSP